MNAKQGIRLMCLLLSCLLLAAVAPGGAQAAEAAGRFILVAEVGGQLVIAPEYISYTQGQTLGEALQNSGHTFTGMEQGLVTAIDDVTGNFTRSDQNGNYDLSVPASTVTHFRFSENIDGSKPNEGLLLLMTAMADWREKQEDVQLAAREAYDTAFAQFVGAGTDDARTLAYELNSAIRTYEDALNGRKHPITFTDGAKTYSAANYPGVTVAVENPYGRAWTDDGDGKLELPVGSYTFLVQHDGLRVEGTIAVSEAAAVQVQLPGQNWLKLDQFRLSGSYGAETNEEHKFTDAEFALGAWTNRQITVPVTDLFSGAVYAYAEYDTEALDEIPELTAVYTMANSGETMEKNIALESLNSGAFEVLGKGGAGNTVIYRLTHRGQDGYIYSQDYTVRFTRIPSLTGIQLVDQNGVDQAPTTAFVGTQTAYTYKVLDTVNAVTVSAAGLEEDYTVTVNGQSIGSGVTVAVNGVTDVQIAVRTGDYTNTYVLTVQPGEGRTLSFLSDKSVQIQVVNSNGVVMPYTTHRETDTQNRYKYTLVPGETYHYIATKDNYYHIADDFRLEEVANSIITVDFAQMDDWLKEIALGTAKGKKYKDSLPLNTKFSPKTHSYEAVGVDTEHNVYLWVDTNQKDVRIDAIYTQVFSDEIYHGKELTVELIAGSNTGERLNRLLMDENPVENMLTVRLTKEENGLIYYQDYQVELKRALTLGDISAQCDGVAAVLIQADGTAGFVPELREYSITVSMAAHALELTMARYTENLCFGEEEVGYRILVDGVDVTESGMASVPLDGTINTQTITVFAENDKAPEGTGVYTIHVLKSPPVATTFQISPAGALLNISEVLSGQRIWPDETGSYQLCEGYSYAYTLTEYGYVGKSGTLEVTRNFWNALVVQDGDDSFPVTEAGDGGIATVTWSLEKAPENSTIQAGIWSPWPNFRGNNSNNAVTDFKVPTVAEEGTLYWANKLGEGYDSDAVGSPILVGGDLITYAGNRIFRIDTVSGEILATGTMDHKSSFSITPPTYAEGIVFVALSNGCVQAFNAVTLESLWIYNDPLGGQPNCPLAVKDGYLYTGFWNSETGDANFVCLSVTDEDPTRPDEEKCMSWFQTAKGGYYWAGAYVGNGYVLVGTDDGTNLCNAKSSSMLLLDAKTGALLERKDGLNGDIRSTVVYDSATDSYYFTSKGGTFYSFRVSGEKKLTDFWSVELRNGVGGIPMSTCSPVVYNGRAYVGVSGSSQFGAYSGHNITVVDLASKAIAYTVNTQGYPQTSGLLTTAYEAESGYVYVYFFDNMTPGKLRGLRDRPGMYQADYVTAEMGTTTAYALFTPTGEQAQYAICSPVVDEYGTVYFKNDSAHLMAFGSAVEKLEITKAPDKTAYLPGEKFDPTGMVVIATYANGKTRDVTQYVTWYSEALTEQDSLFTVSFPYVMYHNQENGTEMASGVASQIPNATLTLRFVTETLGDVDGSGTIDARDAQLILDYEAKLLDRELSLATADVSGDGIIDSNDAVLISQYIAGIITAFPGESTPKS